jgi:peptidoglycan/LPS O-acetylase OafA/YrhL
VSGGQANVGELKARPPAAPTANGARQGQFLAGDAVRGIAMTSVILLHLAGGSAVLTNLYTAQRPFAGYGSVAGTAMYAWEFALPMFLALSGYLISGPWVRAYVLGKRMPSLRRYAIHRVCRIVPVFWLLGAAMLLIYGAYGSSPFDLATIFGFAQVYHKSGAANFLNQTWTIDVEVAFYVFVPIIAFALAFATRRVGVRIGGDLSPRARVVLILGLLTVASVASAWLRSTTLNTLWTDSPPATLYCFAPGIALAALELEFAGLIARRRPRLLAPLLGLGMTFVAVAVMIAAYSDSLAMVRVRGELAVAAVCGLALGALLTRQLVRADSPRWVDNPVTRWLGARAYPCYIVQSATITTGVLTVGRVGGGPWAELLALMAFVLPLTFAVGALVHATVERPVLAWGRARTTTALPARREGRADAVALDPPVLASVSASAQETP